MAWDPTAAPASVWRPIDASRDEDGNPQARVQLTKWNAGKRLSYENRMIAEAIKYEIDERGARIRRVMPGKLRLLSIMLTVTGSEGFPDGADFTSEAWLNTLDEETFDELERLAVEYQPLPTGGTKRPSDRKAPATVESGPPPADDDEDEGDGDAVDPSRRPSTPAA